MFTALLFVVKPFLGFCLTHRVDKKHNILVKIFSKRRPEFLNESEKHKAFVSQQLIPDGKDLVPFITALLTFFPLSLIFSKVTWLQLNQLTYNIIPDKRTYLLNGKLII